MHKFKKKVFGCVARWFHLKVCNNYNNNTTRISQHFLLLGRGETLLSHRLADGRRGDGALEWALNGPPPPLPNYGPRWGRVGPGRGGAGPALRQGGKRAPLLKSMSVELGVGGGDCCGAGSGVTIGTLEARGGG